MLSSKQTNRKMVERETTSEFHRFRIEEREKKRDQERTEKGK